MNNTILVTTDFSDSSKNALDYAAGLASANGKEILLLHIYVLPTGYAAEAMSLVTINDSMESEKEMLKAEWDRIAVSFPGLVVTTKMVTGDFVESLGEVCADVRPNLVVFGAFGAYSELGLWQQEWLRVVSALSCPVLVVPQHIKYSPAKKIAVACDYKKPFTTMQLATINSWTSHSVGQLHIVHVTQNATADVANGPVAAQVKKQLTGLPAVFHVIANKPVIESMAAFVTEYQIDLVMVIPRSHTFWYSLFNKSYSRQLAQLNNTPVLAMQDTEAL